MVNYQTRVRSGRPSSGLEGRTYCGQAVGQDIALHPAVTGVAQAKLGPWCVRPVPPGIGPAAIWIGRALGTALGGDEDPRDSKADSLPKQGPADRVVARSRAGRAAGSQGGADCLRGSRRPQVRVFSVRDDWDSARRQGKHSSALFQNFS